jgi:uncharacterized protein
MRNQNVFYVYALKDPRTKSPKPFYIGKGAGTRAWDHELRIDGSQKGKTIKAIKDAGHEVLTVKLVENLTESEALKIEAELIAAFGTERSGGCLANVVVPGGRNIEQRRNISVPEGLVEKSQIALELLKAAVWELAKANREGVTNYDVAKCLGLQSDYGGGSKNYLSYSLLGILMREGKITRLTNKKHKSALL